MPKFIIVGLDHFLQNTHDLSVTEDGQEYENDQKRHLVSVLDEAITSNRVTLICEESRIKVPVIWV